MTSSRPSDNALSEAIKIAEMSRISNGNIQIILLHVIQEIPVPASYFITGHSNSISSKTGDRITLQERVKELHQKMKADATKMLNYKIERFYNKMKQERQFDIKAKVSIGYTAEFANEEQVDLIIMGTTGLTGISRSVARAVSEMAKCPVMLVR